VEPCDTCPSWMEKVDRIGTPYLIQFKVGFANVVPLSNGACCMLQMSQNSVFNIRRVGILLLWVVLCSLSGPHGIVRMEVGDPLSAGTGQTQQS